jgi:antitoxin HicB
MLWLMPGPTYTVIYEPQPEGGYTVAVPALPGCVTEGDTLDEARRMAEDAIRAYCESLLKDGEPLPPDVTEAPVHERLSVALAAR